MIEISLSKNPEVNRLRAWFAFLLAVLLVAALLLGLAGRHFLKKAIIDSQAALIGALAEEYPAAEQDLARQIMDPGKEAVSRGREILSKYGLDSSSPRLETPLLQRYFRRSLLTHLLLALLAGGAFFLTTILFLRKQYGQIRELTRYAARISAGDYSLDIRDNREGDLSILKNEIYKITTLLKEQATALQREKALLADSLADISHQLKTPLTSISVLTDLLSENPADEKKDPLPGADEGTAEAARMAGKLAAQAVPPGCRGRDHEKEKVPVRALVEKALATLAIPLEVKMLQICIEGNEEVSFTGDLEWSCEALINIIKNCIEHSPEGGRLRISFAQNPLYTAITVADSGAGIAPEDLPYIFNRFYKGKNAAADQVGIGLAMARAIVEKHGGDISVKSEPGRGSEFTIKFYTGRTGDN